MQFIRDLYAAQAAGARPVGSFEFFAPKTDEGDRNLLQKTVPALLVLKPAYCSVTCGAGGSTRDKTLTIVDRIQRDASADGHGPPDVRGPHARPGGRQLAQARTLGIHCDTFNRPYSTRRIVQNLGLA